MDYFSIFIEMLEAKNVASNTIRTYKTYIKPYLSYLDSLSVNPEDVSWNVVRSFLKKIQTDRQLSDRTLNFIISMLQTFWIYVLHKPWDESQIPLRKFNTYLPYVPDRNEMRLFLQSLDEPKVRLACSILYACGLRIDELCHLECHNIYLSKKRLYIPVSKNHADRYVPLPVTICNDIKSYWYGCPASMKPKKWLFTQQRSPEHPMDHQWLQKKILDKRKELGIDPRFCAHSFRHAFATHSYENGLDLITLKTYLGHRSINSTAIYLHLAESANSSVVNPFDQLGGVFRD